MGESIGPKLLIEGEKEFKKALVDIRKEFRTLDSEMKLVASQFGKNEKSMEYYRAQNKALENAINSQRSQVSILSTHYERQRGALTELEKKLAETAKGHAEDSKEVIAAQREYRTQLNNVRDLEKGLNDATASLNANERQFAENIQAMKDYGKAQIQAAKDSEEFKKAQEELKKSFDVMKKAALAAGAVIVTTLTGSGKAAVEYESAFAGVRKTVEATEEEYAKLSDGIRKMTKEIPASATAIAGVSEAAGQLGIETENILGFTRVMIDLGEATNMSADEAATSLARLANITGMSQGDFDKLGSVITSLGNSLATTESEIVEMGLRLAGAGAQVGLTEAQIMSFAGSLSSVGIEAQAGGSAFSKVMVDMQLAVETNSERLKEFANVAGVTGDEFKKSFQKDAAGAIISFIRGLGSMESKGQSAIKVLDDMGIKEVRLRDALLRASGASDVFTNSIELGTKAWDENTALSEEAEQRYKTLASQFQILKNTAQDVGIEIGQELMPIIADWTQELKEIDTKPIVDGFKWIINNGGTIASMAVAIGAGMVTWKAASTVNTLVTAIKTWKTATEGMTIAQSALNAVTSAHPIGAMAATIGVAVAAFGAMKIATRDTAEEVSFLTEIIKEDTEAWSELEAQQKEHAETSLLEIDRTQHLWKELQTLIGANGEVLGSKERVKYITDEINKIAPDSIKWVNEETIAYKESAEAIDNLIQKKRAQIILESQEQLYKEALLKVGDKQAEQTQMAIELAKQEIRMQEAQDEAREKGGLVNAAAADKQKKILEEMQREYAENEAILGNYFATIQDYEENSAAVASDNYDKIKEINASTLASYQVATDGTIESLAERARDAEIHAALMRDRLDKNMKGITEDMVKEAEEQARKANEEYETVGGDIVDGLEKGVKNKEGGFLQTVRNLAKSAIDAARNALDSRSPSREFIRIGEDVGEGLAIGVEDSKNIVKRAAKTIGNVLISEEEKIQKQLAEMDKAAIVKKEKESEQKHKEALDKKYAELAKANKKNQQKIYDDIAKLQADREKEIADNSEKALRDSLNSQLKTIQDFKKDYEKALDDIQKSQENMSRKLVEFGGLFERTQNKLGRDVFNLTDLQKDIDMINAYGEALENLKDRGISDSLLKEIESMSVDDALDYTKKLLSKTDENYEEYMALWEEKQTAAQAVASKFYQDEMDSLQDEFVNKLPDELSHVKDEMRDIGIQSGQGLALGFRSQAEYIKNTFVSVLESAMASARASMDINSPSERWADLVGAPMAQGLGKGFTEQMREVTRQINASIPTTVSPTVKMGEGIVNGLAGIIPQQSNQPIIIQLVADGKTLAQTVYDPLNNIARQKGVPVYG